MLKSSIELLLQLLTRLYNKCVFEAKFVTKIEGLKKIVVNSSENFCPITIIPVISKILGKFDFARPVSYFINRS